MSEIIEYFVSGHTAKGYVNYLDSNIEGIKNIIVLKHTNYQTMTQLCNHLINDNKELYDLEIIYNPAAIAAIGGLLIREKSVAILDNAIVKTPIEGANYVSMEGLGQNKTVNKRVYLEAYDAFKAGLAIHDQLEGLYIREMDFNKADQIAKEFIENLLAGKEKSGRQVHIYERLFGTNTPFGMVNCVDKLIEPFKQVVYVKGRAGTGKSYFMRKVCQTCAEYGYDIEIYHCSFDPDSIDMVVVRDLDLCMFDSTDPHEFFPKKPTDLVIDLYETTVTPGTDEKYAAKINQITRDYKAKMKKGLQILSTLQQGTPLMEKAPDTSEYIEHINQFITD